MIDQGVLWMDEAAARYGHKSLYTLVCLIFLVLFGSGVFRCAHSKHMIILAGPQRKKRKTDVSGDPSVPRFNALVFSVDLLVPFLRLNMRDHWVISANARGGYMFYSWLHSIAGWFLSAIFLAQVTGLMH